MSNTCNRFTLPFLAVLFPVAAFADISGTLTLTASTNVNMDTGAAVSSGGDFSWNGTTLTPQGSALALNASTYGFTYATLTSAVLAEAASLGSSKPLTGLATGTVVGYETNGGNFGKFMVTNVTGTTLAIQYTTYESTTPTITEVQNNYSLIVPGLPNYGIAPGTLFIIRGTNLASVPVSSITTLQNPATATGIPTTLNGAQITVTVGTYTAHPGMYYAGAMQIAAVLPSGTPAGTGTITVSYGGATSNAATITVVTSALGLDTYYGSGSGLGVATDAITGALITYTNSAKPGEILVLWGSGLGADSADSDTTFTSTPHPVSVPLTVYIGGIAVTPGYAGSSGFPGLNQINVTVPSGVATGCGISVVGLTGTGSSQSVTNSITLPIAQGGGVCTDPLLGYNGTQLANGGGGQSGNYTTASLGIFQGTSTSTSTTPPEVTAVEATFQSYSGGTLSSSPGSVVSLGSCFVSGPGSVSGTPPTITGLDAGTITVQGPAGSQTLTDFKNPLTGALTGDYEATVANSFLPATGGTFTFTATGGANVGAFTASISLGNILTWTNESSITSVTRANGQQITWSGGTPNSYVYVSGTSSSTSGASATFVCYAPVSQGQITVPNYVLLALPAGTGTLGISNAATPTSFTASGLTAPGVGIGGVSFSISPAYN